MYVYLCMCMRAFMHLIWLYIFFHIIYKIYDIKFIYIFYSNSCIQDIGPGGLETPAVDGDLQNEGSAASLD